MKDLHMARIAAVSPKVHLGDCKKNAAEIMAWLPRLYEEQVQAAVFPELCLTGYTCGDLLLNETLQREAAAALFELAEKTGPMAVIVGLPISNQGRLYNCAAVLQNGKVRGVAVKCYLPNGGEFYETRWFKSGRNAPETITLNGETIPFGMNLMFDTKEFRFAIEICEDLWGPNPPSSAYAPAGAEIIFNPSASNELAAKHDYRRELLRQQSGRCFCGYAYAGAGYGESTTDLVFSGFCGVYENGRTLPESPRFKPEGSCTIADVDIQRLRYQRQRTGSFFDSTSADMRTVPLDKLNAFTPPFKRPIPPLPFVPEENGRISRCDEITSIQTIALFTRLSAANLRKLVVGISGGLDSALALLVAARAFREMGLPPGNLHAITMPGFGTGQRTYNNARLLMEALGCTIREVDITPAVRRHFEDIGQDESVHDVAYENSQARERTQILMDYANRIGALVLGTGDLSESALGFSTYNGDHMSMYNVNCSIPKTLVRTLVRYLGENVFGGEVQKVCEDIIDTPISPELLPADKGELTQRTEEILGDYALHDFFLYHMMDSGSSPDRLYAFARQAFDKVYADEAVLKALKLFLRRFFTQQFKRSCMPDGPKVGSVSLSPRGDWRMPSDMLGSAWADWMPKDS
jgi:NAD+ synthase (glutamine-hydrolysing)